MPVDIVPAAPIHFNRIAKAMRAVDQAECIAMGRGPKHSLRHAWRCSVDPYTAMSNGAPVAMFGVIVKDAIAGVGWPWFLGTDAVESHARDLITIGPEWIKRLGDSLSRLENLVSCEHAKAIRLLERWEFDVNRQKVDVNGVAFCHFSKELR